MILRNKAAIYHHSKEEKNTSQQPNYPTFYLLQVNYMVPIRMMFRNKAAIFHHSKEEENTSQQPNYPTFIFFSQL